MDVDWWNERLHICNESKIWFDSTFVIHIGSDEIYRWKPNDYLVTQITDKYWCNTTTNGSAGKGRDQVVINMVPQSNNTFFQACLSFRRLTEPGPFICKRALRKHEGIVIKM